MNKIGEIKTPNVTVIFVSDGADSCSGTLEKRLADLKTISSQVLNKNLIINFLCVAVGVGFPTFIAMRLREIFHSGDSNTPSLFLIDT